MINDVQYLLIVILVYASNDSYSTLSDKTRECSISKLDEYVNKKVSLYQPDAVAYTRVKFHETETNI